MLNLKNIFPFVFLLFPCMVKYGALHAQNANPQPSYRFETFELPGGELGNHVQAIAQDSFGFMWFGSQFGLHRWDGYQLKTYYKNPEDSTAILSNYVEYIYVAKDGTLWLAHWGHGLDRFDYATETFHHYVRNADDPSSLGNNYVAELMEDQEGNIWVATHHGVYRLDVKTGKFKSFLHDPEDPHSLSYNKCRTMLMDSAGTLWFGTGYSWEHDTEGGLNRYRPETEDFVHYLHAPYDPSSLSNNKVSEIFEDSKGNFWVGTIGDGLHLMDRSTGEFQRLQRNSKSPNGLCGPFPVDTYDMHIRFIYEDQNQKIWIGAWNGGIKYYDPKTGHIQDFYKEDNDPESLPENFPWIMLQSNDGTLWGCTAGAGGTLFKLKETIFDYYPTSDEGNYIISFCESKNQKIWVGTEKSGLQIFDTETKKLSPFDSRPLGSITSNLPLIDLNPIDLDKNKLLNKISKIVEGKDGRLWLKKWEVGLVSMHPETGGLKIYKHDPKDENSIGEGAVTDIYRDEKDRIWILTTYGDLNLYEPRGDYFIRYKYANVDRGFYYHSVMTPASEGKIWIAGSGLNFDRLPLVLTKFDPETAEFEYVDADIIADDPMVKYERTYKAEEDNLGNVWIASETRLKQINPNTNQSIHFGAFHFGSLFFRGLVFDEQGRLWLFGDKISLFDPDSGIKSSFDAIYDIKSMTNYSQTVYKHSNGIFYVGGKGGFQCIDSKKIGGARLSTPPETVINDFQVLFRADENQEKKKLPVHILASDDIHLSHDQNAFSFRFAALDFHDPKSNRHEFKLEGYDEQWRSAGVEPTTTYIKVPPGKYTFRVRGATQGGEWGPEKTVNVKISPPWWATWWAYSFYTLLFGGLLYAFYYFQLNRKLDKAEAQRLKELDTVKTRLYTNITHEFRTPLTVISGMASQVEENPKEWFGEGLAMIKRNSNRLLELVNQMLDLSKLESGKMALNLQQGDFINYLKYIVESFHSFAESQQVQVHFHADVDEIMMDFDHEKMQQVMTNLLSNAVKFTPEGGHIYVRTEAMDLAKLKVSVRDTGRGIPETQLPQIFDRFYQVDDTATRHGEGTGIGLALVKELVKLMDGEISAKSKLGKGTEFTLFLPIRNEAPILKSAVFSPAVRSQQTTANGLGSMAKGSELPKGLHAEKPHVLLIEDNPDVVAYIASCLQTDYQIKVGKDGQEGIDIAIEGIPDLIITDVMMPFKDGFEVCETLKNDERTSHIPIIMLTAKADMDSKLEGLEQGADAYLAKPFHKKELLLRIKKLLELRRNLQQFYLSSAGLSNGSVVIKDVPQVAEVEDYFVKKARKAVEEHLDDFEFNVDALCRAMNLSHSQLHRKLSALTGYSAQKFIRYIRLAKAKELLQNPELSITAVAFDSGFNDPGYFGRVFRKEFGVAPTEWRERKVD